jgi:raffinose/stachyose/melibiose transport system substrate-binding protein
MANVAPQGPRRPCGLQFVKEDVMINRRRLKLGLGIACVAAVSLAACSSAPKAAATGVATGKDPANFTVLIANEDPALETVMKNLAAGACATENKALPLQVENVAQADVTEQVTLLASQGALPDQFIAGTSMVRPNGELGENDLVLNFESALKKLGVWNDVLPSAASTVTSVYGQMVSLPYQYNIEGIFYNKQIFSKLGLSVPTTFDELTSDAAKLKAAGYMPFAMDGSDGWPVTRLIGMYIYRSLGPNAMEAVQNGTAKLTDPKYVEAAQAVQTMAEDGYFGTGFVSTNMASAENEFLTGKAAMMYNLSSPMLSVINDPSQDQVGANNVGLMPFPTVAGGAGNINQWPANAGAAMAMNPKDYGPKSAAWLKCIMQNYGSEALKDEGVVSGFKINTPVANIPAATQMVQTQISGMSQPVLWFEALMDAKSTALAQENVSLLTTGKMSPQSYMSQLQASIDANK